MDWNVYFALSIFISMAFAGGLAIGTLFFMDRLVQYKAVHLFAAWVREMDRIGGLNKGLQGEWVIKGDKITFQTSGG